MQKKLMIILLKYKLKKFHNLDLATNPRLSLDKDAKLPMGI